jgi:hypothetical protein
VKNLYDVLKETLIARVFMRNSDYKVGWVLNDASSECMICSEPFSLIYTRHHCRACGCLACNECCSQEVNIKQLPARKSRVCDVCAAKHPDGVEWDLDDAVTAPSPEITDPSQPQSLTSNI